MPEQVIWNPAALYGLQWTVGAQRVVQYVNASGRTLYTGDAVVLAQASTAIKGAMVPGGSAVVTLSNTSGGTPQMFVPGVAWTGGANDPTVVGVVGVRDASTIDNLPGGSIGTIGGSTIANNGTLTPVTTTTGIAELGVFPVGATVPVIVEGPARVNCSGQTVTQNQLLATTGGATQGNNTVGATGTVGNIIGIALEASTYSAAGAQTADADANVAQLTITAGTSAASATTLTTLTDPRSAANDVPSGLTTTGIFPTSGAVQFSDTGVIKIRKYTALGASGFTVSATTIATGVVSGTTVTMAVATVRALIKLA